MGDRDEMPQPFDIINNYHAKLHHDGIRHYHDDSVLVISTSSYIRRDQSTYNIFDSTLHTHDYLPAGDDDPR